VLYRSLLLRLHSAFCFQAKALDQAMKEINNRFGKNSVMKLGSNTFGEVYVFDDYLNWILFIVFSYDWEK